MKKLLSIIAAAGCVSLAPPALAQYMPYVVGPALVTPFMGPGYAIGMYGPMAGYGAYHGYAPYHGYGAYHGYSPYYGYGYFGPGRCITDEGYGRIAVCNGAVR